MSHRQSNLYQKVLQDLHQHGWDSSGRVWHWGSAQGWEQTVLPGQRQAYRCQVSLPQEGWGAEQPPKLKGNKKKTATEEDLTSLNYKLLKEAKEHSATLDAWSSNGKIHHKAEKL